MKLTLDTPERDDEVQQHQVEDCARRTLGRLERRVADVAVTLSMRERVRGRDSHACSVRLRTWGQERGRWRTSGRSTTGRWSTLRATSWTCRR